MRNLLFGVQLFILFYNCSGGIDESYPYSEYYYGCISGRYFGDLGFVSDDHPVSECLDKCQGLSKVYSILTYVPNKDTGKTCCLGCSCADLETLDGKPLLDADTYCNRNFTEGTAGVCWSSCYDSVYCTYGKTLDDGSCPM